MGMRAVAVRGRAMARLLALAVAAAASPALGHGGSNGTFDDVAEAVFERRCATSGCHGAAGTKGGLNLEESSAWAELLGFGFGEIPDNGAARTNGKKRVDPGRPWNSFLVDKLRGHLRAGEGSPMPQGGQGWEPLEECVIREIENWILRGAPRQGWVEGDTHHHDDALGCNVDVNPGCVIDPCAATQPALAAPPPPPDGLQLHVVSPEPFVAHDALFDAEITAANGAGFVTRIEVFARPGTRYVTVSREGDAAPIMLALGDPASGEPWHDVLELPAGTGIAVEANQRFVVRQALRADAFDPLRPEGWAEAYVNLGISTDTLAALEPFADDLGTQALLAPARAQGTTGGVWQVPEGTAVSALRLWADARAIRGLVLGPEGVLFSLDGSGRTPWRVEENPLEIPAGTGLAYACQHDNTALFTPQRLGCGTPIAAAGGLAFPPPGVPPVAGGEGPAPWCAAEGDCEAGASCVAANLVGGTGVEDGRCTLLGLRLSSPVP